MPTFTVQDLARHVDARIEGDPDRRVVGVAPLGVAGPNELTFLARDSLRKRVADSAPGVLVAGEGFDLETAETTILRVENPELAFARLLPLFHPVAPRAPGVHPSAIIGKRARLAEEVGIGPHAIVGEDASIGPRCDVGPCAFIGRGARLGADCRIAEGVSILPGVRLGDRVQVHSGARIGTDGYGYAKGPTGAFKIPQVGGCVIGDDVEIGANCTIDRGALGDTTIGARTKIDNLVHIGHNVEIGADCMIVAQVGIAGSVRIGDGVQLAGQVGVAGHLAIGDGARVSAQSGVISHVPAGETWGGYPAQPHRTWLKMTSATRTLPALVRRLVAVERRLRTSEEGGGSGEADPSGAEEAR